MSKNNQHVWIIEPRDPVIVRDGRPFDNTPGARARTLPFPYPSTLAGMVRTRAGTENGKFTATKEVVSQIRARGPLLVQLEDNGSDTVKQHLVPAPADALLLNLEKEDGTQSKEVKVLQLVPLEVTEGLHTAMPDGLLPVGPRKVDPAKPSKRAPRFWYWEKFEQWLREPEQITQLDPFGLGLAGLKQNSRMHVVMDPEKEQRKGRDGGLFQTIGLEFTHATQHATALSSAHRLALLITVAGHDLATKIGAGFDTLGGERRTVVWRNSSTGLPECPPDLVTQIQQHKSCRIILLTPAIFTQGYRPEWLCTPQHGVTPTLRAVCCTGYEVISGWDYDKRAPKPTRRMLPAGSVLYLSFADDSTPAAIAAWVQAMWMQNISDAEQDRRDGFGLAAIGVWDGKAVCSDWGMQNQEGASNA
jgi:CRISPR-associated protein Cmr3